MAIVGGAPLTEYNRGYLDGAKWQATRQAAALAEIFQSAAWKALAETRPEMAALRRSLAKLVEAPHDPRVPRPPAKRYRLYPQAFHAPAAESLIGSMRYAHRCDCGCNVHVKIEGEIGRGGDQAYACEACGNAVGSALCDVEECFG